MARAADFRMSCGALRHPKAIKLRRKLGADGVLSWISLISFCAQYRTSGSLAGMDGEETAIASDWSGDPQLFVNTLIEIGLLDRDSSGVLSIHDWAEHNPYAAGFEERSKRAQQAARSRWDSAGNAQSMQHASDARGERDCGAESAPNADRSAPGNAESETGTAPSNAGSTAPSNAPSPFLSGSDSDSKSTPRTLLPPSSAATAASSEEEFKDSPWLISFLKEQTTFNGNLLPKLIHHDFWVDVSESCNGIDANFLRAEFAKMAIWLREKPKRAPTPKGVRQFVAHWLQQGAEKRRRAA